MNEETSDNLKRLCSRHLKMLKETFSCSKTILNYAVVSDLDNVIYEIENRERLINIVGYIQAKVESIISNEDSMTVAEVTSIKDWNFYVDSELKKITECDNLILNVLEGNKSEISKEISKVFKSRLNVKKYNLTNVMR